MVLTACRKFKHEPTPSVESCELCSFAESLNGVYKGKQGPSIFGPINYCQPLADTFEYHVQHVFLNKGEYIDSTVMFFHIWGFYQTQPLNIFHDTISINNENGFVATPSSYGYNDIYLLNKDSVRIYDYYPAAGWPSQDYTGYR